MELSKCTALELAAMLHGREIKVCEVLDAFAKEDVYNAFICRDFERAYAKAEEIQKRIDSGEIRSALAGVPTAVKDNICVRDFPATCGSKMLGGFVPPYDAAVVKKLKQADMIILGKTNMDEFAMGSTGETSYFKAVRNPRDVTRTAGGSSGGSAAAVAGGLAPLALGSDTGGSVRQPCAYCGTVGLKPTYGAVSRYGLIAYASSLDTVGVIAGNVPDAAALFGIIKGRDANDSTSVDSPVFTAEDIERGGEYRIKELDTLPLSEYAAAAYYIIACAEASSNLARYDGIRYGLRCEDAETLEDIYVGSRTQGFGNEVKRRIMLGNFVLSEGYYDEYYLKAMKVRQLISEALQKELEDCDFILAPTVERSAPRFGECLSQPLEMYKSDTLTVAANLAGLPALTLKNGMQLIGKRLCEKDLLKAGYNYEI